MAKTCLRHNSERVVEATLDGRSRCFVVTRNNFWKVYEYVRQYWPKDAPVGIPTYFNPEICAVPFMDDPTTNIIIGIANDWKHNSTPPWELYPDCDRGWLQGLCRAAWTAHSEWEAMRAEEIESKVRTGAK